MADYPMLTINLSSSNLQTKAPIEGVQNLNENLIKTIHYFLYPMGKTNEPAVLYNSTPITTSKEMTESFNVPLDETLLSRLFVYPQEKCKVFLIVNLPEGIALPTDTSLDNLKKIAVEANFSAPLPVGTFVMTGEGEANLQSRTLNPAATGTIGVDRLAAKLVLNVKTTNTYDDAGTIWTSEPKSMKVSLFNCVNNAELSGVPVDNPIRFDYSQRGFYTTPGETHTACVCDPFYTYPIEWTPGVETEPYFFIMLPWTHGTTHKPCYYKVILSDTHLDSNNWYNLNLALSVLGSFNENEPTVVVSNANYYVVNWGDATDNASDVHDVIADIHGARFLVVDQNLYELNNQETLKIQFSSSHECEIVDMTLAATGLNKATVTRPNYKNVTANPAASVDWNSDWSIGVSSTKDGYYINFSHAINNELNSSIDYAPYTIKFRVRHKDAPNFYKDITIIQNPAMIIEANHNRDLFNDGYGGAWVNNTRSSYGGLNQISQSVGTKNPNMYVIKTSVLEGDSELIIGDPRSMTEDNLNNSGTGGWATAPAIEGGNRKLVYYYPTSTSEDARNMIAPKFRIASSHNVCPNRITYTNAQYRCASYQEDGYPAGRWRLPTPGEIRYMVLLSSYGIIPALFSNGMSYWCAGGYVSLSDTGAVTVNTGVSGDATNVVRCVYDEWYWEKSQYPRLSDDKVNTFTWGDAAR